jgi:2,4-dienoyl-CoA reductase-like NADH-dependent reductase (Old Yellow Enzyme family)
VNEGPAPYSHLFEPGSIGRVRLRNRIVQSAMGTGLAEDGRVSERDRAIQEERAAGGVGLIVFGGTAVHPTSRFPARILIESWDEAVVDSLRQRADAVHRHGSFMFGQLIHLGREAPGGQTETVPLAPSAIASPRSPAVPHEMTHADIREIVEAFGRSAENYAAAGIDGAEVHAAHGYLVAQFLSPASNRRGDAYRGDTVEGRTRFLVEIVEEIRSRCGPDFPVGARLSADEHTPGGLTLDDTLEIVDTLQETAPVDYLSITAGQRGGYVKDSSWDEGYALGLSEAVKQLVDVPVIVAGRIRLPDLAERALAAGQADFVAVGRGLLADPEWAEKARTGRPERIRPCVGIVQDCRRYAGGVTCTINPRLGRELEWGPAGAAASRPGRVVVVGAGPAGLEAARVAAEAGHAVVLFERETVVGGQLRAAAAGPTREELLDFVFYLERELDRLEVDARLSSSADADAVVAEEPDLVVCATGATPLPPTFPVEAGARVVDVWELLGGRADEHPRSAVVVDDGSGFWHGISAAELLAERGASVELVTPARAVGLEIPEESVANVHRRLRSNGVRFRILSTVTTVHGTTVRLEDTITGEPSETTADLVVARTSLRADDALRVELEGRVPALAAVGDCAAPRRLNHAVLEANLAIRQFHEGRLGPTAVVIS